MDKLVQATPSESASRHFVSLAVPDALRLRASQQGFDVQAVMDRFLGKTELFQRMVQSFAVTAQQLPRQLRVHLAAANLQEAVFLTHSFKGLASTLGADQLAALGDEGEALLKGGVPPGSAWLVQLEHEIAQACPALIDLAQELVALKPLTPAVARPQLTDGAALKVEWRHFLEQLQDGEMGAAEIFAELRPCCPAHLQADLDSLAQALAVMNFERAHGLGISCLERWTA